MLAALVTLLAFNPLQPIVNGIAWFLLQINGVVHNYGWSLIILAAAIKLVMWPLNAMQFKSMLSMQELQPKLKALQSKYKGDKEGLNAATMALYKENGANPLAGCLPLLLQMPVLYSVFFAITSDKERFLAQTWLWIGSAFAAATPIVQGAVAPPDKAAHVAYHLLATSLAVPDYFLLALYIVSMYFSVRFTSPPSPDPSVAQQQRIMAFVSPAMIGYFGFRFAWPSGLLIYWLAFNIFQIAQQLFFTQRYRRVHPLPAAATVTNVTPAQPAIGTNGKKAIAANGTSSNGNGAGGGSRAARRRRSSRR